MGSGYWGNNITSGTTFYITKNKGTSANLATDWEIHGQKTVASTPSGQFSKITPGQAFTGDWFLLVDSTGEQNTSIGSSALVNNSSGTANTATGATALSVNTSGQRNTGMGHSAMGHNTTGGSNTAIGYFSGLDFDESSMTGSNNTFLGT